MTYTIIGNDGKSYGPVSAEQIRGWIKQARVENRTPVFVQGSADWTFVGLLPEFAPDFYVAPPLFTSPKPGSVASAGTNTLAIWGFICGLLGWTCCGCCVPFDLLGLTFSIIALVQVNAAAGRMEGRGFAIAGIVLSAASLMWTFFMTVLGLLKDSSQLPWYPGN